MTFEQLQERHEALAQTVELLAHRLDRMAGIVDNLVTVTNQDAENIRALARVAEIHE